MKKIRQILAIIGIILLVAMYFFTLIAALLDDPRTMHILGLSIALTIIIPVLIWMFGIFIRVGKNDREENEKASGKDRK